MELIRILNLKPLPSEGGKYRQTYASADLTDGVPRDTAIYYMLEGDDFSHLHRLPRNELYHFYLGDPVELTELLPDVAAPSDSPWRPRRDMSLYLSRLSFISA